MPSTYTLIKGETLTSSAASYTFSAIPSTFTDLVVRVSSRSDYAGNADYANLTINSDTSSIYSNTALRGNGTAAASYNEANVSPSTANYNTRQNADTSTSNTFSSLEIYIPSYTASQNKAFSQFGAQENNNTTAELWPIASLYRSTTAISSLKLQPIFGTNFLSGSSFYLYGVKNA
jgi:hypothetical protein